MFNLFEAQVFFGQACGVAEGLFEEGMEFFVDTVYKGIPKFDTMFHSKGVQLGAKGGFTMSPES